MKDERRHPAIAGTRDIPTREIPPRRELVCPYCGGRDGEHNSEADQAEIAAAIAEIPEIEQRALWGDR